MILNSLGKLKSELSTFTGKLFKIAASVDFLNISFPESSVIYFTVPSAHILNFTSTSPSIALLLAALGYDLFEFIFSTNNPKHESGASTFGNIIVFTNDRLNDYSLFSHEIIHIYQYYDFNFINTYLNKPINRWRNKSKTFKSINDVFYFDMQVPILRGLYLLENLNRNCYYDNFFENEAGFYSKTKICE